MAGSCPAPGPNDPIVHQLTTTVDCNVQTLAHDGYSALFGAGGGFGGVLTVALTLYVALLGYQLMLGRGQLRVSDFAVRAVSLGAVLALATQWDTYQAVVYRLLFDGPRQIAAVVLAGIQPPQSIFRADVFDGLQRAFDDLTGFANGYATRAPANANPLLGGTSLGALLLTAAGSTLLLSTLGVILASKIVLGLLLGLGPLFIVMFLFDATRGVFEGWLRATLAFAFAPMIAILLLGVILVILEPNLLQIEQQNAAGVYVLAPTYAVVILILVFVGVMTGALIAVGMIAGGFKWPRRGLATVDGAEAGRTPDSQTLRAVATQSRAEQTAAAAAAQDRRDALILGGAGAAGAGASLVERRTNVEGGSRARSDGAGAAGVAAPVRLGQDTRRVSGPRAMRAAGGGAGGLR
jgi:type IV secretion system protein VirB6